MNRLLKDLLILEVETTGTQVEKDVIIQLTALLLDKDNLLEKDIFNTYIRTSLLEGTLREHSKVLGIPFTTMQQSPKTADTLKQFAARFQTQPTIAVQSTQTIFFLRQAFRKALLPFELDGHIFDLWTIEYIFSRKLGLNKIPTLDTLLDHFNLTKKNMRNALERARLEAEVLRRIIKLV